MNTDPNEQNKGAKANDKLHSMNLGETKDFNNLSYDRDSNSFEFDVKGKERDYDHPLPYETSAPNGEDSISTYDEANPYVGSEYDDEEEQIEENFKSAAMRVGDETILEVDPEDEVLSRTEEDYRDDLDEEGYPVNDRKK